MILRVSKEQTVLLYQLLEGYEGMANYSTLDSPPGAGYRDIALFIAPHFATEFQRVLAIIHTMVDFRVIKNPE